MDGQIVSFCDILNGSALLLQQVNSQKKDSESVSQLLFIDLFYSFSRFLPKSLCDKCNSSFAVSHNLFFDNCCDRQCWPILWTEGIAPWRFSSSLFSTSFLEKKMKQKSKWQKRHLFIRKSSGIVIIGLRWPFSLAMFSGRLYSMFASTMLDSMCSCFFSHVHK